MTAIEDLQILVQRALSAGLGYDVHQDTIKRANRVGSAIAPKPDQAAPEKGANDADRGQ